MKRSLETESDPYFNQSKLQQMQRKHQLALLNQDVLDEKITQTDLIAKSSLAVKEYLNSDRDGQSVVESQLH